MYCTYSDTHIYYMYSNIHTDMYYGICIVTYTCTVHIVTHTFTTCIVSIVTHIHTYTCSHTHVHVHTCTACTPGLGSITILTN